MLILIDLKLVALFVRQKVVSYPMISSLNVKLTKCQVDKISSRQDVKLTRCQVDKMSSRQDVKLKKCQVDKCQVHKMSS
jgi:hypothetical protein